MPRRNLIKRFLCAAAVALCAAGAGAQTSQAPAAPFQPQVGQAGKDVVWVPTPQGLVDRMLDMAQVTARDYLIDLGSGDGRLVITAAKRGLRAHGIEYNPDMVALATRNAASAGVADKATFAKADIFESDFSKAQVITMFLLPSLNLKLRPTLMNMRPGTRIVSNSFTMAEWQADETISAGDNCESWCTAYFWVVPAKVAGVWRMPQGTLTLMQQFQMLSGTLGTTAISDGRMRGEEITFTVGTTVYSGRLQGHTLRGTVSGGSRGNWSATKR